MNTISVARLQRLVLLLIVTASQPLTAQNPDNPGMKELAEKRIPWSAMLPPSGNAVGIPKTLPGRVYSKAQLALIDTFITWIKRSIEPIGGLPEPERIALPKGVASPDYIPHGTGVSMRFWGPAYDKPGGTRIVRSQPASASNINIIANYLPGVQAASWFNTTSQYYFTMGSDANGNLIDSEQQQKMAPYVRQLKAAIGDYLFFFNGRYAFAILIPGNKLPIVPVSRAEFLDIATTGIKKAQADGKSPDYMATKQLAAIALWRDKYRDALAEPALVRTAQVTLYSFDKDFDIFQSASKVTNLLYPVYKIDPVMYELCQKDRPQWITISWIYGNEKSSTLDKQIWQTMTQKFNFRFVYDFAFNPRKVQGISYTTLTN